MGYKALKLLPMPANFSSSILNKKPSVGCGNGIAGCKNIGSFNSRPYTNSKKVLYGLLALNVPVTVNFKF